MPSPSSSARPGAPSTDNTTSEIGGAVGAGDGRIHVVPSLSAPSARNGDKLTISTLVTAEAGVAQVQAEIEDIETIELRPEPGAAGGRTSDGAGVLWSAQWTARGLEKRYYRVRLRVTDRTGHVFEDDSLRFSDPIAGLATVGTPGYSPERVATLGREGMLTASVIDTVNGYAYFGCSKPPQIIFQDNNPSAIIKVALGSGSNPPTRVGALLLEPDEENLASAVIDVANGYAYFGTSSQPATIVKISLGVGAALPTRVGAVTLSAGSSSPLCAVIDVAAGYAYFGTARVPGRIAKIDLGVGAALPTLVGFLTLDSGESRVSAGVIDTAAGEAYFAREDAPGEIIKVALGAGAALPKRVGLATLNFNEGGAFDSAIDVTNGHMYMGLASGPGNVAKVRLNEFQDGSIKATRMTLPEAGDVDSVHFYSHEASGNARLSIYDDAATKNLLWESDPTSNTVANGTLDVLISAGTPTSLNLAAGDYWLAWQVDTTSEVPSLVLGGRRAMAFIWSRPTARSLRRSPRERRS